MVTERPVFEVVPAPPRRRGLFYTLGQLAGLLFVVGLTVSVTLFALHAGPFAAPVTKDAPVVKVDITPAVLHAVHSANQLVTAETQVDQIVTATSMSRLPGSQEKVIYFAVYDIKAGVDLSQIKDSDITVEGDTVRIVLPPASIISQSLDAQKSYVITHEVGPTTVIGGPSKELMDAALRTAESKAQMATLADDNLLKAARESATANLTALLNASGITNVVFVDAPTATAIAGRTPAAAASATRSTATPHR